MLLNDEYWSERYIHHQTGWDLHKASPPLKTYIDQWPDKNSRILIPGCGNAYEADYLLQKGFQDITLVDISSTLVHHLKEHFSHTNIKVVHADFFEHEGQYDLILEQTFFCALDPVFRQAYVKKMHELLSPAGKLVGLLFNRHFEGGPPFGGTAEEYQTLCSGWLAIHTMETCYNSIPQRAENELFFIAQKSSLNPHP